MALPTITLTHPSSCDANSPCGPWVLKADSSLVIQGVRIQIGGITGASFDIYLATAQDIFANPLSFTVDFRSTSTCDVLNRIPCIGWSTSPSNIIPTPGGSNTLDIAGLTVQPGGGAFIPDVIISASLNLTNNLFAFTFPTSCFSDKTCAFKIATVIDLDVSLLTLLFFKKGQQPGSGPFVTMAFSPPVDLKTSPETFPVIFNTLDPLGLVVPPCGTSDTISTQLLVNSSQLPGGGAIVNGPDFTLSTENCIQTQMHDISTTQDVIGPCVGVAGVVGIEGVLDTVGALGLLQTFENQPVHIGLIDPTTGTFYEYELVHTTITTSLTSPGGRFSGGFGISNRSDVVALVPVSGTKAMQLAALYEGDDTHSPTMVTKDITVQGQNVTQLCFTGTLVANKTYNQLPTNVTEVHQLVQVFTTSIIPGQLQSQANALLDKVASAIIGSGAVPLDVLVYEGPSIPILSLFGINLATVPTLIVIAHAYGSPVAALVILLAIVVALIALGIIVYFISQQWADIARSAFNFCQQNPQLCQSAVNTAEIVAVTVLIGVAAVVGFYAYSRIRRRR